MGSGGEVGVSCEGSDESGDDDDDDDKGMLISSDSDG